MGNCTSSAVKVTATAERMEQAVPRSLNANEKLSEALCRNCNARNCVENLDVFFFPDAVVTFVDSETEMTYIEFAESVDQMKKSFLDLNFSWDEIKETEPGKVIVKSLHGRGTHNGEPYSFGPYPPIPPNGKRFVDPPLDVHITIDDGKVSRLLIYSFGKPCGPPGAYEQVGGILF